MNIQDWIEEDDWSRIMDYLKEDSSHKNHFINVFLQSDANSTLYRVQQFVKCCLAINKPYIGDLFTECSDFFQNAIGGRKFDVLQYLLQVEDTIPAIMIERLIIGGARFARLVPNDQLEAFMRADEAKLEAGDSFIAYVADDDFVDLSGLLYAAYVCSDVYLKSIYMHHYNKLLLHQN